MAKVSSLVSMCAGYAMSVVSGSLAAADLPPTDRVSFPAAQKKALSLVSGKIKSASLEHVEGSWRYFFEIKDSSGIVQTVYIDALTGEAAPVAMGSRK